jgi:hypothetical protein
LESILFPSATFAQGYETFNVTLKDNSEWTGILVEQSGESILVRETSGALRRFSLKRLWTCAPLDVIGDAGRDSNGR